MANPGCLILHHSLLKIIRAPFFMVLFLFPSLVNADWDCWHNSFNPAVHGYGNSQDAACSALSTNIGGDGAWTAQGTGCGLTSKNLNTFCADITDCPEGEIINPVTGICESEPGPECTTDPIPLTYEYPANNFNFSVGGCGYDCTDPSSELGECYSYPDSADPETVYCDITCPGTGQPAQPGDIESLDFPEQPKEIFADCTDPNDTSGLCPQTEPVLDCNDPVNSGSSQCNTGNTDTTTETGPPVTNPDGSVTETTTSTTTNPDTGATGTTTTTTTTNPDGSSTTTTNSTGGGSPTGGEEGQGFEDINDVEGYCKLNPLSPICQSSQITIFNCETEPVCVGDAIQCAVAREQWKTRCEMKDISDAFDETLNNEFDVVSELDPWVTDQETQNGGFQDLEEGGALDTLIDLSNAYDTTKTIPAVCPSDYVFNWRGSNISFSFAPLCQLFALIGLLVNIASALLFFKIVSGAF